MTDFRFNINDKVRVKLTDKGKEILDKTVADNIVKYHLPEDCNPYKYRVDSDGNARLQLWDFMNIFGSHMFCGAPCYIEHNEIIFESDDAPTNIADLLEDMEDETYNLDEAKNEEYSYKAGWNACMKRAMILAESWARNIRG